MQYHKPISYFLLLVSVAFSVASIIPVSTTAAPPKVGSSKSKELDVGNQQRHDVSNENILTAKRNVPEGDNMNEEEDDVGDDDVAKVIALGPSEEDEAMMENAVFKAYGDNASGYYGGAKRTLRSIVTDDLLNTGRPKRELGLTPEEVLVLLSLLQENRHQLKYPVRYSGDDNTLEGFQNDNDEDAVAEQYPPNFWADALERPTFNRFNNEKRFMIARRKRNLIPQAKVKAHLLKRAIL